MQTSMNSLQNKLVTKQVVTPSFQYRVQKKKKKKTSNLLHTPSLLHYSYTQVLMNALMYTLQAATTCGLANITLKQHKPQNHWHHTTPQYLKLG